MAEYLNPAIDDLKKLGVKPGGILLVHSSLRSLGDFENRADIIIEALLQALGPDGTLLMPALSYESVTPNQPVFDAVNTQSCVGALTEFFRKKEGVLRSLHPTHSVCGIGKRAEELLSRHVQDATPVGPNSPFRLLMENNGQVLFLGCGLKPNTSMHGVEELVGPSYLFTKVSKFSIRKPDNTETTMKVRCHDFKGWEQRYDRLESVMPSGAMHRGRVLQADCYLLEAPAMWQSAHVMLKKDPLYFVDKKA